MAGSATVRGFVHLISDAGVEERFTVCLHPPTTNGRRAMVAWTPGSVVPLIIEVDADSLMGGLIEHMEYYGMLRRRKDDDDATAAGDQARC